MLYLPHTHFTHIFTHFVCIFPFSTARTQSVSINAIPVAKQAAKMIKRKAMSMVEIKQEMLAFCKVNTQGYEVACGEG